MKTKTNDICMFLLLTFLMPFFFVLFQRTSVHPVLQLLFYGLEAASPSIAALLVLAKNRQLLSFFKKNFTGGKSGTALLFPCVFSLAPMPVSYTHLDVYKRQYRYTAASAGGYAEGRTPAYHIHQRTSAQQLCTLRGFGKTQSVFDQSAILRSYRARRFSGSGRLSPSLLYRLSVSADTGL